MPEAEVFKILLNLGSFGLLAIMTVWLLWTGAPMLRNTMAQMSEDHRSTIDKLTNDCRDERQKEREWRSAMQVDFKCYIASLEGMKIVPR